MGMVCFWRGFAIAILLGLAVSTTSSSAARAAPPPGRVAALMRGVNITGWFRFAPSHDPAVLRAWLSDAAMADIRAAGFTFVRLAVDPEEIEEPGLRAVFLDRVRRLQGHGLAVIVSPHPAHWNLDANPVDRQRLADFWRDLAPALRDMPPELTFPELVNEPVFKENPAAWSALQHRLLVALRAALPSYTIVLTGNDWGGVGGLLALTPEADPNVVYSFHFYDPPELTSLAAYLPNADRAALSRLPFPETDEAGCDSASAGTGDKATAALIRFYCSTNWNEARVRSPLREAAAWARRNGAVLLAGEFGASTALNPRARLAWLRLVRETCAANGIGWALWGYDDSMGLNVQRPPSWRPALDRSVLAALGLPLS